MGATKKIIRDQSYSKTYQSLLLSNKFDFLENSKKLILTNEKKYNSRLKSLLEFDQLERFPSYILRRVDHLSMANSVEVRIPFCQPKIISIARSLRDDFLVDNNLVKKIVYQGARKLLPRSVVERKKQPFTLPIVQMLKKGFVLFDILNDTLNSQSFKSRGIFNQKRVIDLINRQLKEQSSDVADFLWSIMILELWLLNINGNLIL